MRTNIRHVLKLISVFILIIPLISFSQKGGKEVIINTYSFTHNAVKVGSGLILDNQIVEGSGLINWNDRIYTHNDSGKPVLFSINPDDGSVSKKINLPRLKNDDWEDMTQDSNFIYIGNFGNNGGNRKWLQIYRIQKDSLLKNRFEIDSISFQWPVISDFGKINQINFDCEAMISRNDSIFLFTKEWRNHRCTRIFKIPTQPGNYTAEYVATIKTRIMITGASYSEDKQQITLCGYSLFLNPRLLILQIPKSGNLKEICDGRKIRLKRWFQQIEGICQINPNEFYLISEATNLFFWKNKPKLYKVSLD